MLRFDEDRKLLYAFRNDIGVGVDEEIPPSVDYESFKQYISKGVKEDVMNIFLPRMRQVLKVDEVDLDIKEIKVSQVDRGYFDDKDYHVMVKWSSPRNFKAFSEFNNEWVSIMRLPMVDEQGIIYHEQSRYALIKMLEQEETVSFDCSKPGEERLKVKTSNAAITLINSPSGIVIELSSVKTKSSRKKYKAIYAMAAKARDETGDIDFPLGMWNDFSDYSICKTIPEHKKDKMLYLYGGNAGSIDASEYLEKVVPYLRGYFVNSDGDVINSETYKISELRGELNELLSLKRAVGGILAKDVYSEVSKDVCIARRGEQVDNRMIKRMEAQRVTKLYLEATPSVEGLYLASPVFIDILLKGTKIIPEIAGFIPEEEGMYVSKNIFLKDEGRPIMLDIGTRLTMPLVELLRECGAGKISIYKDKVENASELYLMEEVISNRHFTNDNFGKPFNSEDIDSIDSWSYVDWNGEVKPAQEYLTSADLQALISLFSKLCKGQYRNIVTNIDSGFRKQLVMLDNLMHRAFRYACNESFIQMGKSFKAAWKEPTLFFTKDGSDNMYFPFAKNFFKYMRDETKSLQVLSGDSMTNPISFTSAMTKINTFVKDKNSVADEQRRIAVGSYSRVDAYETPQSGKMGTVLNKAIGCMITPEGKMLAPYYKVKWGKMGKPTIDLSKIHYFSVKQEERFIIGDITSLQLKKDGTIINKDDYVLCRVPSTDSIDKHTFSYVDVKKVEYVNADPNQSLSWAAATVPFLGSNDAARAIFGISQSKQGKGPVNADIPYAMTKANLMIPRLTDEFALIAKHDGVVIDTSTIRHEEKDKKDGKKRVGNIWIAFRYDGESEETGHSGEWPEISSTKYSTTVREICVKPGQRFKKGDVLMTSNFIVDGILSMGKNALVGFIPTGYNYEDGSDISTDFCNSFLSYRENHETFQTSSRNNSTPMISNSISGRWITQNYDTVMNINWKQQGAFEGKVTRCKTKKASGFLERIEPQYERDAVSNKKYCTGVEATLISIDPLGGGDKTSNRHGNKGVLAPSPEPGLCARPTELMPRLLNGRPLDIAYNPLGTISRMNMGQCKECNATLPAGVIGYYLVSDPYNGISDEEVKSLLAFAHRLANSTGNPSSIGNDPLFDCIPENLKQYAYRNIDSIRFWADTFDERGEAYVLLPDNNMQLTKTKILIGWIYIYKLIQESEKKVHVRGGMMTEEPYNIVSGAPTEGSSNHGGQRYGTMEMDAVIAYGMSKFAQESTNACGDNATARSNLNVDVFAPPSVKDAYKIKQRGQRRSVTNFLYSFAAMGVDLDCDNDEFIPLSMDNCDELVSYNKTAIANIKDLDEIKEDNVDNASPTSSPKHAIDRVAAIANVSRVEEDSSVEALLSFGITQH